MTTTITSRQFNQDASGAKRAARSGPVFITDRGEPSYVLLSMAQYRKLGGSSMSIADMLGQPEPEADFDFDPPKLAGLSIKPVEFD